MGMPSPEEMSKNMDTVFEKYGLSNVIGGIDGCHIPFLERPRNLPHDRSHVVFINRKGFYSINSQIIGGMNRNVIYILYCNI